MRLSAAATVGFWVAVAAGVGVAPGFGSSVSAAGTLQFRAVVDVTYPPTTCPAGRPETDECFVRGGIGIIRGLGQVRESYPYVVVNSPPGCSSSDDIRVAPATVVLSVAGKGQIELRLSGSGCLTRAGGPLQGEEAFTITGGNGVYAGASGAGRLTHVSYGPGPWRGTDTWTGTLNVPGLDFDTSPPTITGARNKVVKVTRTARRARVSYSVTAADAVDGKVPANCNPRSGSYFRLGITRVRCSARDTSANTATANFTVTVKRR